MITTLRSCVLYSTSHPSPAQNKKKINALNGFVSFVGDIGLLGNKITVIEIENIRKNLPLSTNGKQIRDLISYEEFYHWLRSLACCLYYQQLQCPKKSLHQFLIEVF
jgi:hypothetical protein